MQDAEVKLRKAYNPQPHQQAFHSSKARFRVICSGRRSGKTYASANELIKEAWLNDGKRVWWVAPSYKQAMIGWRMVLDFLPMEIVTKINRSDLSIELTNETVMEFKSAEIPDNLRGEKVWFMVIDEAAQVREAAWQEALRPTLADSVIEGGGKAIFISTPKGMNWFYDVWQQGQDPSQTHVQSWKFTTAHNKFIPRQEIMDAKQFSPELAFRQEWMAEFLSDVGAVFRNIEACIQINKEWNGELPFEIIKPNDDEFYYIGVDIAKHQDFTVITVMDSKGRVVYWDRFNQIDWTFQCTRILAVKEKYRKSKIILDSTGAGDPVYDFLSQKYTVESFKFTNESKSNLVQNLSVALEQLDISYPKISVLVEELRAFGYERSEKTGKYTYNAPEGKHDDAVISLGLATWGLKSQHPAGMVFMDVGELFGKPKPIVDPRDQFNKNR